MIEDGALENPHVDRCFALHLYSGLDVGKIGVRDGPFFASSDRFDIELTGTGGHGAMPHAAVDPIVAASQLVSLLQTIPSREIAPSEPVVVTVGALHAGTTFNVIPERAHMQGSVRAFRGRSRLRSAADGAHRRGPVRGDAPAVPFRVPLRLSADGERPRANAVVRRAGREVLGEENVVDPHEIVMWSEDMSFMQEQRPGAYFLVGARGPSAGGHPQHSAHFDIDERALEIGYEMMVALGLAG